MRAEGSDSDPRSGDIDHTIERELARLVRGLEAARQPGRGGTGQAMDRAAYLLLDLLGTRPSTLGDLASELHLDQSTVTRQVAALTGRNLVHRTPDPDGGRAAVVELTPEGRRQLVAERTSRTERISRTMRAWNDSDRAELARLLVLLNVSIHERLSLPMGDDT